MDPHTNNDQSPTPAMPPKPKIFQGDLTNLPPALQPLKAKPNWVLWQWEFKGQVEEEWTKVPYQPNGGSAKSNRADLEQLRGLHRGLRQ